MLKQLLQSVFGPSSKFVAGDTVQPAQGERELMVVAKVVLKQGAPEPQLLCRWVDSATNEKREQLFRESDLTPFDWSRPMQRVSSTNFRPATQAVRDEAHGSEWLEGNEQALIHAGIDVQLGISRLNGNRSVYQKLLNRFSDGHQHFASELKTRAVNGEWAEAQRMAHTMKGLAGTLGMINLQGISQDLESSVQKKDLDELRQKVRQLSDELERILRSIRENVRPEETKQAVQNASFLKLSFQELEQSLRDHNPMALSHLSQLGVIKGHEIEVETLGQAIASYQYDKALTVLRDIKGHFGDPVGAEKDIQ